MRTPAEQLPEAKRISGLSAKAENLGRYFRLGCLDILLGAISIRDRWTRRLISSTKNRIFYVIDDLKSGAYERESYIDKLFRLSNKTMAKDLFDGDSDHYNHKYEYYFEELRSDLLKNAMVLGPGKRGELKGGEVCFYTNTGCNSFDVAYDRLIAIDLGDSILNRKLCGILLMYNFFISSKTGRNTSEWTEGDKFIDSWENGKVFIASGKKLPKEMIYV